MARTEIRLTGFGGQGVIMAGYVIGRAAAVEEGRHATLNQSFGPEARGSACSAQLILSDDLVTYPYLRHSDILVAMSQDAYRRFVSEVRPGGLLVFDDSLVEPDPNSTLATVGAPATRIAEEIGKRIMANMVMVGLFTGATQLVSPEAARAAITNSVPTGTSDVNLAAFERGLECGLARAGTWAVREEAQT